MKPSILISYAYKKRLQKFLDDCKDVESIRLIIDSGAFTAWKTGKEINIDEYIDFLNNVAAPTGIEYNAIQLDVVGDSNKSLKNLEYIAARCKNILPVFTTGDSYKNINILKEFSDYICLGGIASGGRTRFCDYVRHICDSNPELKFHLLGVESREIFNYVRNIYSTDSSSVNGYLMYHTLSQFNGKRLKSKVRGEVFFDLNKNNSLIYDVTKFYNETRRKVFARGELTEHNLTNSQEFNIVMQQRYMYYMYIYYKYKVRCYYSISSSPDLYLSVLRSVMKSREVIEYENYLRGKYL